EGALERRVFGGVRPVRAQNARYVGAMGVLGHSVLSRAFALNVRHAQEGLQDVPVDRPPARQVVFQVLLQFFKLLLRQSGVLAFVLDALVGIEQLLETQEVVRFYYSALEFARGATGRGPTGLRCTVRAPREPWMGGVDAGVEHRPTDVGGSHIE